MFTKGDGTFNWLFLIPIILIVLLLVAMVVVSLVIRNKKKKANTLESKVSLDNNKWVNALGGKDNVVSIEAKGSRMIVVAKDYAIINKDELHDLGVVSVISSQNKITLVLKEKAENISNLLQ